MSGPRVLVLDIENSPTSAWTWDLWNVTIPLNHVIEPGRIICFAAKWVGEKKIMFHSEYDGPEFIEEAFKLLDEADAVVGYNSDGHDIPHLQREFAEMGLGRPSPFHSIDLLKTVKKHHKFLSRKLAYVTERLELSGKMKHEGFDLWKKWMAGDEKAIRQMTAYNKRDVKTTEELYHELLPWIDNHPTHALFTGEDGTCPKCGSDQLEKRGFRRTKISTFQRYQCQDCGSWSSSGKRIEGVDVR